MKRFLTLAALAWSSNLLAGANCAHSNSWQCSQHHGGTLNNLPTEHAAGATPSGTATPPLGSGTPGSGGMTVLPTTGTGTTGTGTQPTGSAASKIKKLKYKRPVTTLTPSAQAEPEKSQPYSLH